MKLRWTTRPHPTTGAALVAVAALALFSAGCAPSPTPSPPASQAKVSGPADFLKQQQLEGKIVLIEFGLVGCALSDSGLDQMIRMHREKKIQDLAYVRVEESKDAPAADRYFESKKPGFTVYRDPDTSLARSFEATVYPTFVLVDKFGRVRHRGPIPGEERLVAWVDSLRRETADPGPGAALFDAVALDGQRLLADTRLPDLQGAVKPFRDYLGTRGVLAIFVDTTCPFSGQAIGDVPTVAAAFAKQGIATVLVNLGEPKDAVQEFYAKHSMGVPVLYDVTAAVQQAWGVNSVPTVMVIEAGGTVMYQGKAVWKDVAVAAEKGLKLSAGSINVGARGTEYG